MIHITVIRESIFKRNIRLVFFTLLLSVAAVFSHLVAASWVIEILFVALVFFVMFAFSQMDIIKDKTSEATFTEEELKKYVDAGCPEVWPPKRMRELN